MNNASILLLFAPKFREFGCDVAREYLKRKGGGKAHGLCTGPLDIKSSVQKNLGKDAGIFWHLHTEEKDWLKRDIDHSALSQIESELGSGAIGRLIVSDRRVGRGFVRGGLCRPDKIGNWVSKRPDLLPQHYISSLYFLLNDIFNEVKPDMVFCYAVAGAPGLLMAEMAKARGIPFSRINSTRIEDRFVIEDDPKGRLSNISRIFNDPGDVRVKEKEEDARNLLKSFRAAPNPPEYMLRNKRIVQGKSPIKMTARAIASIPYHTIKSWGENDLIREGVTRSWFNAWVSWRKFFLKKDTFSYLPDNVSFIYYPLHVDPEASTQVLSPMHTDQLAIIEALAKSAPANMLVVVKEHLPMLGVRPRDFYKKLKAIPRVVLIGPENDGLNVIKRSSAVAVITGTSAWEALRLGKPAVVIGDSPYLAIGSGLVHEPCLANLPCALNTALKSSPAVDEDIVRYLSSVLVDSFSMPSSLIWGSYLEHKIDQKTEAVSDIVDGILSREKEQEDEKVKSSVCVGDL